MKKFLCCASFVLTAIGIQAQSPFFQYVPYKGAFAPAPEPRWTDGWTNFDPQNAVYAATNVNVSANISVNTHWTSNNVYLLNDAFVYVLPGVTLTIDAGTLIRGTGKGTLIVERGAKIIAKGSASQPIVFTSNNPVGGRDYGDWGGVVVCGAARHNLAAGVDAEAEGGIGDQVAGRGLHGGNNDDDSSGVLSFVRIEFCGISLTPQPNSEINGLSMYSVGRKTQIDHIQVSYSGDDSFEWFGGTVDCKYLFAHRGWDDDFDTDNGFSGRIQFAACVRDSKIADQSGSNGFESDNDKDGSLRYPKTTPVFSNVTIIGPDYQGNPDSTNSLYKRALHLRRNTKTTVFNSIFTGYPDAGLNIDGRVTTANVCGDSLEFTHNILAGMTKNWKLSAGDTLCLPDEPGMATYFMDPSRHNTTLALSNDVNLVDPFNLTNPDLRPASGSVAESGADFSNPKFGTLDVTSVPEVDLVASSFALYPNPASETVTLTFAAEKNTDADVLLMDLQGKTLMHISGSSFVQGNNQVVLNVSQYPKGVYLVAIQTGNTKMTRKLVLQ